MIIENIKKTKARNNRQLQPRFLFQQKQKSFWSPRQPGLDTTAASSWHELLYFTILKP